MAPGSRDGTNGWQPERASFRHVAVPTQGSRKSNGRRRSRVTAVWGSPTQPSSERLALGSGSGTRKATGDAGCGTSKGADEQSSRRAPGSLVDPGVCFVRIARLEYEPGLDACRPMRRREEREVA